MAFQQSEQPSIDRRGVPKSVRAASGLMVAGGLAQLLRGAVILSQYAAKADDPTVTQAVVFLGIVEMCGLTALWIWMAVKCRAGRGWARVTASVLFALQILGMFMPNHSSIAMNTLAHLLGFVILGIGLAAVIALWTGDSNRYF